LTLTSTLAEMLANWLLVLAVLQAAPPRGPRDTLRFYAVGDLNLGRVQTYRYLLQGDTLYPFAALADTLRAADVLFGNLESPIAPLGAPFEPTGYYVFSAPPVAADALVRAGFDVVSNANNHAWDVGLTGIVHTLEQLDRVGLAHAGTGRTVEEAHRPAVVERKGWRIAVFAVTRAFNPAPRTFYSHPGSHYIAYADSAWLYPAIRRLKADSAGRAADLIVVSVHAGQEFADTADVALRRFMRGAVDAGADIVLGHHPHVLQPLVWYKGKPIVSSLGNFVFATGSPWTGLSAIFKFTIRPDGSITTDLVPTRVGAQATFADSAAADSVRRRVGIPSPPSETAQP
jgi:poly-gamma-glutamate capsule biosynthesis protein CapA/YwtB (metallophosphatase superfamily)